MEKDESIVEPYNTKELAGFYRVTPKTFRAWLKRSKLNLGTRVGNSFSPRQVKIIFDHLGKPFIWLWSLLANFNTWLNDNSQTQAAAAAMKSKASHQGHTPAKGAADHHHHHEGGADGVGGGDAGAGDVSAG